MVQPTHGFRRYNFQEAVELLKRQVWLKGRPIANLDPNLWRLDICGAAMHYLSHGVETQYGWEIDHVYPKALGGTDEISNLQPLQWQNNRRKGDQFPWYC